MEDKNVMKQLYKHFGKEKEDDSDMDSIANIFYEMGKGESMDDKDTDKHCSGRISKAI